jgi:hypothetical protein
MSTAWMPRRPIANDDGAKTVSLNIAAMSSAKRRPIAEISTPRIDVYDMLCAIVNVALLRMLRHGGAGGFTCTWPPRRAMAKATSAVSLGRKAFRHTTRLAFACELVYHRYHTLSDRNVSLDKLILISMRLSDCVTLTRTGKRRPGQHCTHLLMSTIRPKQNVRVRRYRVRFLARRA